MNGKTLRVCVGRDAGIIGVLRRVGGVDVGQRERADGVDLHDRLPARHCVVRVFGGNAGEAVAAERCMSDSTNVVPIPARNVPVSTVTFSVVGCVCGGIL